MEFSAADLLIQDVLRDLQTSGKSFVDCVGNFSVKLNGAQNLEANLKRNLTERTADARRHKRKAVLKEKISSPMQDESHFDDVDGRKSHSGKKKKSRRHKESSKRSRSKRERHHSKHRRHRSKEVIEADKTIKSKNEMSIDPSAGGISSIIVEPMKNTYDLPEKPVTQLLSSQSHPNVQAVPMEEYLKGLQDRRRDSITPKSPTDGSKLPSGLAKFVSGESLRKKSMKTVSSAIFVPRNLKVKTVLEKVESTESQSQNPSTSSTSISTLTVENVQKHNELEKIKDTGSESPPAIVESVPAQPPKWRVVTSTEQFESYSDRGDSPVLPEIKLFRDPQQTTHLHEDENDLEQRITLQKPKKTNKIIIGTLKTAPNIQPSSGRKIITVEEGEIPSSNESADSSSDSEMSQVDTNSDGEVYDETENPARDQDNVKLSKPDNFKSNDDVKQRKVKREKKVKGKRKKTSNSRERQKSGSRRRASSDTRSREVRRPHRSTKTDFDSISRRHGRKRSRSRSHSSRTRHWSRRRSSSRSPSSHRRHEDNSDRRSRRPGRLKRSRSRSPRLRLRHSGRSPVTKTESPTMEETIDKKRLYEIARANASAMLKSGYLQKISSLTAEDMAKLRAGGKSVEELVEYCAKLQKKQQKMEDETSSEGEKGPSEDEMDFTIHHPFELKPHTGPIVMNIPNFLLPKPPAPVMSDKLLTITFPVSSGTQHRSKESEWTPVEHEKPKLFSSPPREPLALTAPDIPLPIEATPPAGPLMIESSNVFTGNVFQATNVGEVITNRLKAMRKLQQNPNDSEALALMQMAEDQLKNWAESKIVPGAFTGSTGVQTLSVEELGPVNPRHQAWARRDQLISSKPVEGGMGMFLLQKMGWRPGEGLGKYKAGPTQPLMMDVKQDRKGLVADEELPISSRRPAIPLMNDLAVKHPVSALMEICAKRKWGPPSFNCTETGGISNKQFLWKVVVNGVEYCPIGSHGNKKTAKAQAAQTVLQSLGLVPRDTNLPVVIG